MSEQGLRRPRQVTVSGGIGLVGALVLVVGLFDTMDRTRSVAARNGLAEFLATPPGSGLGLSVDQALELWRLLLYVAGALAAAAFVLGVYVFQRHNGARIGFTVAAGLLLVSMPAVGVMPILLGVAAVGLWSEPARDWFAGRAPKPAQVRPERARSAPQSAAPPVMSEQTPPPSPYPFGTPPPREEQPADPAVTPTYPPQPPAYPPQAPGYGGQPPAYGPPVPADPHRRPRPVLVAAVLTWASTAVTAGCALLVGALVSADREAFEREFEQQLAQDRRFEDLGVTADQAILYVWVAVVVIVLWCAVAGLLAVFAFNRQNWARILLVVSSGGAALFSLLGILTVAPILLFAAAVATAVLLLTPTSNAWYARRPPAFPDGQQQPYQQPPQPPYGEPRQGPW